jgi:hypothetical protein
MKNLFVIRSADSTTITPYDYGYGSVQWAFGLALSQIEDLRKPPYLMLPISSGVLANPFPAVLQLAALYTGAYWYYAIGILDSTPVHVYSQIFDGTKGGILNYLERSTGASEEVRVDVAGTFYSLCRTYFDAHGKDRVDLSAREPGIYCPNPSNAAKEFFDTTCQVYLKENQSPSEAERYALTFLFIDAFLPKFFDAQQNELGIDFI